MTYLRIYYRDFYDVPRAFLVGRAEEVYFFDGMFDDQLDEYPVFYSVRRLDGPLMYWVNEKVWTREKFSGSVVGSVPLEEVRFDFTKRESINESVFERLRPW